MTTTAPEKTVHETSPAEAPVLRQGVIIDQSGKKPVEVPWDQGDPATVDAARAHFRDRVEFCRCLAYTGEDSQGSVGTATRVFDPDDPAAALIVIVGQTAGG